MSVFLYRRQPYVFVI